MSYDSMRASSRPIQFVLLALAGPVATPCLGQAGPPAMVVSSPAELVAAMTPANAGQRILVRAGVYDVSTPLVVPESASLVGEGVMQFDASGLPTGFEAAGRTVLRATAGLQGDLVRLGDGASLSALALEDFPGRNAGNPVGVVSAKANDWIAASIDQCEVVNPNPSLALPQTPTGRGIVVWTNNPNLASDPPPHDGSMLSVKIRQSIVRSPGGGIGVFAINFSSGSRIALYLAHNVIGGGLNAAGGVSRPDGVADSRIAIESMRNLYRADSSLSGIGLSLAGGSSAALPGLVAGSVQGNAVRLGSIADRIEGFRIGMLATAGQRTTNSQAISHNAVHVQAIGTTLRTLVTDIALYGARSLIDGMATGDGNVARLEMRDVDGSGARDNLYADSVSPSMNLQGNGNRVEVAGSPMAFARTNAHVVPPPPATLFTNWQ